MAYVLGLVGSARPWGNSELLVRQVLTGARSEGAAVGMVRLTDLHLESCTGCMRCILQGKPCPLQDDMRWLLETVRTVDSVVLAAPTYFLGPAAVIKLALDRLLMATQLEDDRLLSPRPAVTFATAGLDGWRGITLPYLNALVSALGFRTIDSRTAIAPGPGEVLLDEALMHDVLVLGQRLGRGELQPSPAPPNVCPICRCDCFVLKDDRGICPICGCEAALERTTTGIELRFGSTFGDRHRWTPEALRAHMVEWVMATGPRFLAHRQEIKDRRAPYREAEPGWLRPLSAEEL